MSKKAIQSPNRVLSALKQITLNTIGNSGLRRFIVLTRSRTGSNMLVSLLRSHPNISAKGEIFAELNGRNYEDILAAAYARQHYQTKVTGFKLFYYHPLDDRSSSLWDDLVNMDTLHVIHLKRRNILRTLLSRKIAESQELWLVTNSSDHGTPRNKRVHLTVEELENGFQQTRNWEKAGDAMFSEHPLLTVHYEDLVDNPQANFEEITEFLGVRYVQPQTSLKKQNPEKISELLANYSELKNAFSGTEWQSFFEESADEQNRTAI